MDCLQTLFLDIPPWLQSNGSLTRVKFLESEPQKDGFPNCECGRGMSDCSIHPNTPEKWIASMQDSLAKTLALLENKPVLDTTPDRGFTERCCVLLASLDRDTYSWKMSQQLSPKDLKKWSKTWPSWGMTVGGCAYAHPMSGQTITETDGFVFLPTPTAHNAREGAYPAEGTRKSPLLAWVLGGKINPQFTEWMMGWPIDFTVLKQLGTGKFRSKSQQRLPSWLLSK